jgi:hypothetical protein
MQPITSPNEPLASSIIIHLIREELKSRRFFEALRELGLDDSFYQTDLLEIIMAGMGLPLNSEECYSYCHGLMRRHSARVAQDTGELLNEAKRVHGILLQQARRYS